MILLCVQEKLSEKEKVIVDLNKEIEKLKEELAAKSSPQENPGTKVVVVTPKITVSMPDGSMIDHGKMRLPMHVLQVLYTRTHARTHTCVHACVCVCVQRMSTWIFKHVCVNITYLEAFVRKET